jgi:hypothetical protein
VLHAARSAGKGKHPKEYAITLHRQEPALAGDDPLGVLFIVFL